MWLLWVESIRGSREDSRKANVGEVQEELDNSVQAYCKTKKLVESANTDFGDTYLSRHLHEEEPPTQKRSHSQP